MRLVASRGIPSGAGRLKKDRDEEGTIETKYCITCGDELHPERARKYGYCTKPECRGRNARGLRVAAVGVNKAADQFVVLNEETEREAASGRYKKQPGAVGPAPMPPRPATAAHRKPAPEVVPHSARRTRPAWSEAQERLAITYRDMGLTPEAIGNKLGIGRRLVTQILLRAPRARR
jgi:hypothetical protein